ncbi:MAG: thiamine diphosphokinase [Oscillospiraceae bacterium]|nr:thiamine diphosphokinase [Oscillospiraceae bacterium]
MRAVIISGGSMTDYDYIRQFIRPDDCVIAADSGYLHAVRLSVVPSVLLGDFDSLTELPEGIETRRVPAEKDFTDTDFAVDWARGQGFREFLFLAATGTRMDHTLTNVLTLVRLLADGERGEIIDEHNRIWVMDSEIEIEAAAGEILSLVPLTVCEGVTTHNLAYPLTDATLQIGHGWSVSNVVLASPAKVSLRAGKCLVMLCRD